jgi:hypothetical protein
MQQEIDRNIFLKNVYGFSCEVSVILPDFKQKLILSACLMSSPI